MAEAIRGTVDYSLDFSWISKSLPAIFNDLRYLTAVLEAQISHPTKERESMWYCDKVFLVERNLVYLSLNPDPEHTKLDTAACMAANIFVSAWLRDLGFYSRLVAVMVGNLTQFLENECLEAVDSVAKGNDLEALSKLFWVLVFGGIAAVGRPERMWFVERLPSLNWKMNIKRQSDGQDILRKILWTDEWNGYFEILWQDIFRAKGLKARGKA